MAETARRTFVATLVFVAVIVAVLALWELRVLVALMLLAFIVAAAMRPTVDRLAARGVPPAAAIALHYVVIGALLALLAWFIVPSTIDQLGEALGGEVPTSRQELDEATERTTGTTHDLLVAIRDRLQGVPTSEQFVGPVLEMTRTAAEIVVGTFFVLAAAAYWIYERERAMAYVIRLVPRRHRKIVRDTWQLVDAKLGAFVGGELLLVVLVAAVLSASFWAIGLPYWLLLGLFAGVVELIPVIGPLAAGAAAMGVAYASGGWQLALVAAVIVFVVRQVEDYLVIARARPRRRPLAADGARRGRRARPPAGRRVHADRNPGRRARHHPAGRDRGRRGSRRGGGSEPDLPRPGMPRAAPARGLMWNSRDVGDGSDQAGRRHRSQARPVGLVKSEDGDPAPCLSHQPARESFTSSL